MTTVYKVVICPICLSSVLTHASMSTAACYAASVQDVGTIQVYQMAYRTLLLSYFNGDTNLKFRCTVSNYHSKADSCIVTIIHFTIQIGQTALTIASSEGHHKVVELLLGAGANPDLQDKVRTY